MVGSPVGTLLIEVTSRGIQRVAWAEDEPRGATPAAADPATHPVLEAATDWLRAYFRGESPPLPPLDPVGTPFQRQVWRQLAAIPFGATATYGDIARAIGKPGASRAVGQANGANPLPILVPCHRILASGHKLGGYSAGLPRKRWLLAHERITVRD